MSNDNFVEQIDKRVSMQKYRFTEIVWEINVVIDSNIALEKLVMSCNNGNTGLAIRSITSYICC